MAILVNRQPGVPYLEPPALDAKNDNVVLPEKQEHVVVVVEKNNAARVEELPQVKEHFKQAVEKEFKDLEGADGATPVAFEITEHALGMSSSFVSMVKSVVKSVAEFFRQALQVQKITHALGKVLNGVHLFAIALVPFHLFHLAEGIYNFMVGKINFRELLTNTLEMVLELTDSIISFLQGLAEVGAIPLKIVKHLWPFDLVGIGLSIMSLIANARGWHASSRFAKDFEKLLYANGKGKFAEINNLDEIVAYINSKKVKELGGALGADGEDIQKRVNFIYQKVLGAKSDEARAEAKAELSSAVRTLHHRVSTKIISHKLAITSASISIIANSVLFASPLIAAASPVFAVALPIIMPLMHSLRGVSSALSISNGIYKMVEESKFNNSKLMSMDMDAAEKAEEAAEDLEPQGEDVEQVEEKPLDVIEQGEETESAFDEVS